MRCRWLSGIVLGMHASIVKNAMEGVEEALYWHTVGILADSGAGIGTAAAIRWNKHCLLVTANHVVSDTADADLRFYFRPPGTMKRAEWDSIPSIPSETVSFTPPIKIEIFDRFVDPKMDVAALIVSPVLDNQTNVRFHDLAVTPKLPNPMQEPVAVIGYPSDSRKLFAPSSPAIAASHVWGNLDESWKPEGFKPRSQLLLKFVPAQFGVHPGGFSGAGVWYHELTPKPGIWSPNIALAGIVTHYYGHHSVLLIVRVESLVRFLDKIAPG